MSRDRNDHYVPDGIYLEGQPHLVEVGRRNRRAWIREAHGKADELNRDDTWRWADVSGDGTHWSHFTGHQVQVDVELHTENEHEVNDWKGRDEIRPSGTCTIALNRQPCWEGYIGGDVMAALRRIQEVLPKLLGHSAIDWRLATPAAEQLAGRRVYYERTPAVVSSTSLLSQGCVILKPAGADRFPPSSYDADEPENDDPYERDQLKVDILSDRIWWWRNKLTDGETP